MAAIRVFCPTTTLPSLRDCLGFAAGAGDGVILAVDSDDAAPVEVDSREWSTVRLLYREDAPPFTVVVTRESDPDGGSALHENVARFAAALPEDDAHASRVRQHLTDTRTIITVDLPADADNDLLESIAWFTRIFVEQSGGLLQADGEGFYSRENDLILALP